MQLLSVLFCSAVLRLSLIREIAEYHSLVRIAGKEQGSHFFSCKVLRIKRKSF